MKENSNLVAGSGLYHAKSPISSAWHIAGGVVLTAL